MVNSFLFLFLSPFWIKRLNIFVVTARTEFDLPLENFDPAHADPMYAIVCPGSLDGDEWELPIFEDWNPNGAPLQEVCAKPQYGGRAAGQDGELRGLSGFCVPDISGPISHPGHVAFEPVEGIEMWDPVMPISQYYPSPGPGNLVRPRLLAFCEKRCYCRLGNEDATEKPWSMYPQRIPDPALVSYQFRANKKEDFEWPFTAHDIHAETEYLFHNVFSASVPFLAQRDIELRASGVPDVDFDYVYYRQDNYRSALLTLHPRNYVYCHNTRIPSDLPIPPPYMPSDFDSARDLCPVELSGGQRSVNAGAYCYPAETAEDDSEVWFSNELTPRPEWTWTENYRVSMIIRHWCWTQCACYGQPLPEEAADYSTWVLTDRVQLIERLHGPLASNGRGIGNSIHEVLTSPGSSENEGAGESLHENDAACFVPGDDEGCKQERWPVDRFGPPPGLAPPSRPKKLHHLIADQLEPDIGALDRFVEELSSCGKQCSRPAEDSCSGFDHIDGCKCRVPSYRLANILGLEAVYPIAVCIGPFLLHSRLRKPSGRRPRLGGRSPEDTSNEETPENWPCPCNTSYVSRACCDSGTGIIWEDSALKMGELRR